MALLTADSIPAAVPIEMADLKVAVCTTLAEIEVLETPWRALEAETRGATLFQGYDFIAYAAKLIADSDGDGRFRVFCAYEDDELVFVLPMIVTQKAGLRALQPLGEPFQQYTDALCLPGVDVQAVLQTMWPSIRTAGADFIYFSKVRASATIMDGLKGLAQPVGEPAVAPHVPMKDWDGFEPYFKSLNAKTRKNMRNARNRLERDGVISVREAESGEILEDVIDHTFVGRTAWLERMGLTSRAFGDDRFKNFLEGLKHPEQTGIRLLASQFMYDDKPIAEQFGFIHNGRYYAFISTWDTAFEESSPGRLHLGEVIRACYDRGLNCADFLVPGLPYKYTWAPEAETVRDHAAAISPLGFAYVIGWHNLIRPSLKKLAYAIPRDWRKKLMPMLTARKKH